MSPSTPAVEAALLVAAKTLPSHFESGDGLSIEALTAIQATTLSLPGGAIAVEAVIKGSDQIGAVVLVIPGLVNHRTGEIFSRDEARTAWTAALTEVLMALGAEIGGLTPGQLHLTDAFDALDKADEAQVVGVFRDSTLAALLLAIPARATGNGAAAQLAAAVAAATGESGGSDAQETPGVIADVPAEISGSGAAPADDEVPAPVADLGGPIGLARTPDGVPAAQSAAAQTAAGSTATQTAAGSTATPVATPVTLQPLSGHLPFPVDPRRIDLLRDVLMGVSVELGRTRMTVQEILGLTPGSIVELDRAAGAPVDVLVNGKLIAHGEVVVVDEEFAVRISEVVGPDREGRVSA